MEDIPEELLELFYEFGYLLDPKVPEVDPEDYLTGAAEPPVAPAPRYLHWESVPVLLRIKILRRLCEFQLESNPDFLKRREVYVQQKAEKITGKRHPLRPQCFAEDSAGREFWMLEDQAIIRNP